MTNGRISEKNFELLREAAIFVTVKNIRPITPDQIQQDEHMQDLK